MKRQIKPLHCLAAMAVVLGFSAWVIIDTSAYRVAMRELGTPKMVSFSEAKIKAVEADTHGVWSCLGEDTPDDDYSASLRTCAINAMLKSKTAMGGLVSGYAALNWLRKNPHDSEIRAAALTAIANARIDLRASKEMEYDSFQNVARANDQSFFLRLIRGRQDTTSMFERTADDLDLVEYQVMLPEVSRAQADWRRSSYASEYP